MEKWKPKSGGENARLV